MSLNKAEQQLFDYVQKNPDERQFLEQKVRAIADAQADAFTAAAAANLELRAYLVERVRVVPELADLAPGISMRNLAEYLLRIWTPLRPKKKRDTGAAGGRWDGYEGLPPGE